MLLLQQPLSDPQTTGLKIKPTNQECEVQSVRDDWLGCLMSDEVREIHGYKCNEDSCKMQNDCLQVDGSHKLFRHSTKRTPKKMCMSTMNLRTCLSWILDSVDKQGWRVSLFSLQLLKTRMCRDTSALRFFHML